MEPTRLIFTNASLTACIQAAYGIPGEGRPDYRLVGGPDWLATERFDIEATSDRAVSRDEMMLMLQSLLAARFKLKAHHETRDLRVYVLTVGKNGSKLAPANDGERETLLQRGKDDAAGRAQELIVQKNSIARFTEYLSPGSSSSSSPSVVESPVARNTAGAPEHGIGMPVPFTVVDEFLNNHCLPPAGVPHGRNYSWAELMKRVFQLEVLQCPRCLGPMTIVATIHSSDSIVRILDSFGLPSQAPVAPARLPLPPLDPHPTLGGPYFFPPSPFT